MFLFVFRNLCFCVCLYRLVCLYLWLSLSVCVSVFVFKTQLSKDTIFRVSIETNFDDDIMTRFFVWTTVSQVWTFLAAAYIVIVPLFEEVTQPAFGLNILGTHFSLLRRELTKLYLIHIVMFKIWCLKDNFR